MEEKTMKEQNFTPKTALIIFAIGLAGGLGGFAIANALSPEKETEIKTIVQAPATMPTLFDAKSSVAENINFTTAAEKCIDGVVHVKTKYEQNEQQIDPFFRYTSIETEGSFHRRQARELSSLPTAIS